MYYIITTKDDIISITEEEYKKLAGKSGVIFIPSIGEMLNLNFVYRVLSEEKYNGYLISKRTKITSGRLFDGTRVIKQFGVWKDANNPEVTLDPNYYPQIAKDEVMSEEEYLIHEKKRNETFKKYMLPKNKTEELN